MSLSHAFKTNKTSEKNACPKCGVERKEIFLWKETECNPSEDGVGFGHN